jgi:hypothetical protein
VSVPRLVVGDEKILRRKKGIEGTEDLSRQMSGGGGSCGGWVVWCARRDGEGARWKGGDRSRESWSWEGANQNRNNAIRGIRMRKPHLREGRACSTIVHILPGIQDTEAADLGGITLAHTQWEKRSKSGKGHPTPKKVHRPSRFRDVCRIIIPIEQCG